MASLHPGLSYDDYTQLPGWRWSHIKLIERGSLLDIHHARANPEASDTPARQKFRAIHTAVLEPQSFDAGVVRFAGKDRRAKAYAETCAANPGAIVLPSPEFDDVRALADSILAHPEAGPLLAGCRTEVSITWIDSATGLPCKARLDALRPDGAIIDLKGCGVFEGAVFGVVARNLWHAQMAHYDDGARAVGLAPPAHLIISYQDKAPFDVAVWRLADGGADAIDDDGNAIPSIDGLTFGGALHHGRIKRAAIMRLLRNQLDREATMRWKGRHEDVQDLILPEWAMETPDVTIGGKLVSVGDEEEVSSWT